MGGIIPGVAAGVGGAIAGVPAAIPAAGFEEEASPALVSPKAAAAPTSGYCRAGKAGVPNTLVITPGCHSVSVPRERRIPIDSATPSPSSCDSPETSDTPSEEERELSSAGVVGVRGCTGRGFAAAAFGVCNQIAVIAFTMRFFALFLSNNLWTRSATEAARYFHASRSSEAVDPSGFSSPMAEDGPSNNPRYPLGEPSKASMAFKAFLR